MTVAANHRLAGVAASRDFCRVQSLEVDMPQYTSNEVQPVPIAAQVLKLALYCSAALELQGLEGI